VEERFVPMNHMLDYWDMSQRIKIQEVGLLLLESHIVWIATMSSLGVLIKGWKERVLTNSLDRTMIGLDNK
jgi:hypothetical protein